MQGKKRMRINKLLVSIILVWVVSIGWPYSFWRFYPPVDAMPFPEPEILEAYESWVTPEIGPIEMVEDGGAVGEMELMPGLYYSRYDEAENLESIFVSDITTGEEIMVATLDNGENAVVIRSDAKRRFLVVWTTFSEGEEQRVVRFRLYDPSIRDWLLFSTPAVETAWVYLEQEIAGEYFFKDASYFGLKGRYFISRLYEHDGMIFHGYYLVFDSVEEDFFTFKALHGYYNNHPVFQDIDRESGVAAYWVSGSYFLPHGCAKNVMRVGGSTRYEYIAMEGYIKKCEVNLTTGALRLYEKTDLPIYIWDIINLNESELLIVGEGEKHIDGDSMLLYPDGRWLELDKGSCLRFFSQDYRIEKIDKADSLIFEIMDISSDHHEQKGNKLITYNLQTDEWEEIAYIPKELFEQEFCAVVSEDAGVICWPLEFEGTGTECMFYDVGRKKNAGTLVIDGRIGVACLVLQENSPYPDEGEVIVSNK